MPRRVPLIRQAEGVEQPQPNGAAGADVSDASASEDKIQRECDFELSQRQESVSALIVVRL